MIVIDTAKEHDLVDGSPGRTPLACERLSAELNYKVLLVLMRR
jgi:hypothetical protein